MSTLHLSRATAIFVVDCCPLTSCPTRRSSDLPTSTHYKWYETLLNCLYHTLSVPQPFLLLIAANLALAGFLGWKWSLWSVPTWLAVQRSKAVFLMTLYDSINDMKHLLTVCITLYPCHSHICCWLQPIWPKLDFWAENGAYGLCLLGWRYNGSKLYFSWPYMILSMIWNTS